MKIFKAAIIFNLIFSSLTNAVIVKFKTTNLQDEFGPLIRKLDTNSKNEFLTRYSIRKVLLKFINQNGKVIIHQLNPIKNLEINNENDWKRQFISVLNCNLTMEDEAETQIDIPQNWEIHALEISYNAYPYETFDQVKIPAGSTNSVLNLTTQEKIELNVGYHGDPINGSFVITSITLE
ncbi:MAG: hypothetical protein Q8K37_04410 [Alphaproteobacteria bacterium]|nr:hypothetical protein [Alphaproteobacteria bacterium]